MKNQLRLVFAALLLHTPIFGGKNHHPTLNESTLPSIKSIFTAMILNIELLEDSIAALADEICELKHLVEVLDMNEKGEMI